MEFWVILTGDKLFNLRKALAVCMGFFKTAGGRMRWKEMKQLMSLFFFVESAEVKLNTGEGDDGSIIKRINELLRKRQEKLEKK